MSERVRQDRDGRGTHQRVESTSEATEPPFISSSLFVFIDSF